MTSDIKKDELIEIQNYRIGTYRLIDVQNTILSIMVKFDEICSQNGINYILDGGSMLGAVRHNGFIPWDDDMDVAMLRKDYKKFVKYCKKNKDTLFIFENTSVSKYWPYNFGKFILNGTIYEESFTSHLKINHGIWIDIFPVDNTFNWSYKFQSKLSRFWQDVRWTKLKIKECDFYKPKHKHLLSVLALLPFWLINLNSEISIRLFNWFPTKMGCKLCHPGKGKEPHAKSFYKEITKHCFCDYYFNIPKDYNKWLTLRYGNPMELPPKDKRKPGHFGGKIKI